MNQRLHDSSHRLGISFAVVVIFVGIALAVFELSEGAKVPDAVEVGAYSVGVAALCYIVVRLIGWGFAEIMLVTREHRARRS